MKPNNDKSWPPLPKQGDLVKCADWSRFPGRVGYVLSADIIIDDYKEDDPRADNMHYKVLVNGQVWDFLGWDVTVINE